jgi:hypothetical protein
MANPNTYNAPLSTASGTASDIGAQARTDYYYKKALISIRDKQWFMPLANVRAMPKNMGKTIKQDVYVPLLDVLNVSDQGIDAAGTTLTNATWSAWNSSGVLQSTTDVSRAAAASTAGVGGEVALNGGNLYGSSKDTGTITSKIPALTENGGRVNRVGFTRTQITGSCLNVVSSPSIPRSLWTSIQILNCCLISLRKLLLVPMS